MRTVCGTTGEIIISSRLSDDDTKEGRYRYSFGHELGHVFYHSEKYEKECDISPAFDFEEASNNNNKKTIIACREENIEAADATCANDWEEWQADYFSACLLMSSVLVGVFVEKYLGKQDFVLNGEASYPLLRLSRSKQMSIVMILCRHMVFRVKRQEYG